MKHARFLMAFMVSVGLFGACDAPDTRNCPLVAKNGSDVYDLEYALLIPANCPVPIGQRGERKRAGARIVDGGAADFAFAEVVVRNSDGVGVAIDFDAFVPADGGRIAEPGTEYSAAMGSIVDLDRAYDYGFFRALRDYGDAGGPYGELKITYVRSAMANVIDGTPIPPRNSTATWRATVTGGVPPYSYYWYRDGMLVGTSELYTGDTGTDNFALRAAVVDQTMTERAAVMPVDVGGALTRIDGPEMAYLYTNDPLASRATWTAAVQGGTAPFTYQWYRDGYPTGGNGASHTEHIDERVDFTLRVVVRDVAGKTAVGEKLVRVGQRDCATCPTY